MTKLNADSRLGNFEMFIQEPATLKASQTLSIQTEATKLYGTDCGDVAIKVIDPKTGESPEWITTSQQQLSINLSGQTTPFQRIMRLEAHLVAYPMQKIYQDFNVTLSSIEITCSTP